LALEGSFTSEQRWLLQRELQQVEWLEQQMAAMEQEIERRVAWFEEPMRRFGDDSRNRPQDGVDHRGGDRCGHERGCGCAASGELGGAMPGESGKWRQADERAAPQGQPVYEEGHVPSGLGGFAYQGYVLVSLLSADVRTQGSAQSGDGAGHHLIVVVYQLLSRGEEYVEMGGDYYDRRNKPKVVARLVSRLTKLGYWVNIQPAQLPEPLSTGNEAPSAELHPVAVSPEAQKGTALQMPRAGDYL
jgi:hypothetical protein